MLEFEPIYREEAKGRMMAGKKTPCINDTEGSGLSRHFMARDAAASEPSVARVLYIREHDPDRFQRLKRLAESGGDYDQDGGPGRGKGTRWSSSRSTARKRRQGRSGSQPVCP